MLTAHLYRLLWLLLHWFVCTCETLRCLRLRLQAAKFWSYDLWRSSDASASSERAFLERCKAQLSKLPRHLSVIVGPEGGLDAVGGATVGEAVLSRIFTYALIMGIDCISLYDTQHELAKDCRGRVTLEKLQASSKGRLRQLSPHHFQWTTATPTVQSAAVNGKQLSAANNNGWVANGKPNSHHNQSSAEKSIEIFEITPADGRPLIAAVCRDLYEQRRSADVQQLLKDRTRLMQRIDAELSSRLYKHYPDPELGIIFNRHTCTFGMLPWHTRFTEFHTLESGRRFDAATFAQVLFRYSRCEQRWGK